MIGFDGAGAAFAAILAGLSLTNAQHSAHNSAGPDFEEGRADATSTLSRDARTRDESSWARMIQANYPGEALRQQAQGSVGVRVAVSALGRVSVCSVTSSSGHRILDEAACSGMLQYARFDPALDQSGRAIASNYSTTITYRLNADASSSLPRGLRTKNEMDWARQIQMNYPVEALRNELQGSVGVRVRVNTEGRVSRCFVTRSSSHEVLDNAACSGMLNFATFQPALDEKGEPVEGVYSTRIIYRLNSGPLPPSVPIEGDGREVIA